MNSIKTIITSPPAGPDNNILGHTEGRSEAYFAKPLHFKWMYVDAIKTFFVVSLQQDKTQNYKC